MISEHSTVAPRFLDRKSRFFLLVCFFASGMCGLVYEITWLRVLSLVFGNTTFATSVILSSYMAGLGLGALYFGRLIDRSSHHPVRFYAWLEGGVGLYAFLTPFIWKLIEVVSVGFYHAFEPSYLTFNLFKFGLAFAALLPPTFLMGGTLPVVAKYFVQQREDTGRYVGMLYGLNTLGAVLGVLFSGFYGIYFIGVWQTVLLAGLANLAIFGIFRKFGGSSSFSPVSSGEASLQSDAGLPKPVMISLLVLFAVSGGVSMMYELAWTRVLAIVLGSSVYAFTVMLATFLLGIALGSWLFSLAVRKIRADLALFAALQLLTAASVFWGSNQFNDIPYHFVRLFQRTGGQMIGMELGKFIICARVMMIPTLLFGAMFTCFIQAVRRTNALGKEVGLAYFSNTMGTILGSALTGFWILPALGIQKTLLAGAALNAMVGMFVFVLRPEHFRWRKIGVQLACMAAAVSGALLIQPWNLTMISSDTAVKPGNLVHLSHEDFASAFREREVIFYKDGLGATVTVVSLKDNRSLAVNGKVDASNGDAFTQYLLGHLPMILHENPQNALVIGLGSGSTVAAVASHPVREIHSVELEEAVVEASKLFPDLNRHVLEDPRVKQFVNDGRNFLLVKPDKYDVIISEPSNPWMAGVANLFSLEHFQNMSRHLNPGGVACQWLHAYSMSKDDLAMIIHTFSKGFPYIQLWTSYYPDLMLLGFNEPRTIDMEQIRRKYREVPQIARDLGPHGAGSPESLMASFYLDDPQLRILGSGARLHYDNKPYLEFSAPRNLYQQSLDENYNFLESQRDFEFNPLVIEPPAGENAVLLKQVARGLMAKKMFRDVTGALDKVHRLAPDDAETYLLAGWLALEMNHLDEAGVHLDKAATMGMDTAEYHHLAGLLAQRRNKPEAAFAELEKAYRMEPESLKYLRDFADVLYAQERFKEALPLYEKALDSKGRDFEISKRITDIQIRSEDRNVRIQALEQMTDRYPRYPPSFLELGREYETDRHLSEAALAYEKFSHLLPEQAGGWINLARVYDGLGRSEEMVHAMKTAVRLQPDLAQHPEVRKILEA